MTWVGRPVHHFSVCPPSPGSPLGQLLKRMPTDNCWTNVTGPPPAEALLWLNFPVCLLSLSAPSQFRSLTRRSSSPSLPLIIWCHKCFCQKEQLTWNLFQPPLWLPLLETFFGKYNKVPFHDFYQSGLWKVWGYLWCPRAFSHPDSDAGVSWSGLPRHPVQVFVTESSLIINASSSSLP